jgi:hypothetical protein
MTVVAGKIGDSDCEELRKGSLAQPANALSSLAYVAVGIAIAIRVMQRRATVIDRTTYLAESLVYAVCLASVGVGSVLFHGPQPAGSKVLHDLPILLTVVFIVNHDLHLVFARLRHEMATFVGAALVATGLTLVSTDAGLAATASGVVAVAVLEFVIYRSRRRRVATRRQRQAYVAIIAVAAVAGASWLLGRTGSPLCDPDDAFQFHGLWHAISSLIFGLWWWLAIDQTAGRSDSRQAENAPADA